MYRRLIVNGDDLGLTAGVNRGVFDAYDRGILTSASLFANAPATVDAIYRARARPSIGIGVHLTLVDGKPTLPPERVSSLVDRDGRFRRSWKSFVLAWLRGAVALADVELELTAQIERIRAEGIRITHLDAHKHVHLIPSIFEIVVRLARRFNIPAVRVPCERWSRLQFDDPHYRRARRQAFSNLVTVPWAMQAYRTATAAGMVVPQFVGRVHTGLMTPGWLQATLRSLRPGVTELMVHPGYADDALRRTPTRLLESRAQEVDLLCCAAIHETIEREAIQLVSHDPASLARPIPTRLRHASPA
jgi:hopanoid biosynthesis associated protein HpnK